MALIKDIITFKKYVKYNFSSAEVNSLLDTAPAERKYVKPILGNTLYNSLNTQVDPGPVVNPVLLDLVRAAIAPLTVYMDLPLLQTQLGDTGLRTLLSEQTQAAHRWEFNQVRDLLEDKGCEAIDQLIVYLYENAGALGWTPQTQKLIFNTGSEFTKFYNLKYPYRTFLTLTDIIAEVEDQYIRSSIGDTYFEELRDKAAPNDQEKEAIKLIKKTVANLTVMKAIEKKPVKITAAGLFTMLGDAVDDVSAKEQTASIAMLAVQRSTCERDGESYLQKFKAYLNDNASATVFQTYYAGSYYVAPETVDTTSKNAAKKSFRF